MDPVDLSEVVQESMAKDVHSVHSPDGVKERTAGIPAPVKAAQKCRAHPQAEGHS